MTVSRPSDFDRARELARIDRLAGLLDARFRLFGIRFGYDGLVGLVPGIGDTLALAPSAWMIWRASRLGLPGHVLGRMALNTGADYVIGLVPLVGDIFDIGFKSNLRNARLLRRHVEGGTEPRDITPAAERRAG